MGILEVDFWDILVIYVYIYGEKTPQGEEVNSTFVRMFGDTREGWKISDVTKREVGSTLSICPFRMMVKLG